MKVGLIVLGILIVAAAGFWFLKSRDQKLGSFWDAVRNPNAIPDFESMEREAHEYAVSIQDSPTEIAALVDFFIFEGKGDRFGPYFERMALMKLGELAYPRTFEILTDEELRARLSIPDDPNYDPEMSIPEFPLARLCALYDFDTPPPREAAQLLKGFMDSPEKELRNDAILLIGSIGSADSVVDLKKALADENEYVRSAAMMGILRAISTGRLDAAAREPLFETISGMWPEDTEFSSAQEIPKTLLSLDRERGLARLLEPDVLNVDFEPLWRILEHLEPEDLPREKLLALIDEIEKKPDDYPFGLMMEEAQQLLGQYRNPDDLPRLEAALESDDDDAVLGAVVALYHFHQFGDRIRDVHKFEWEELTDVERHVMAVEDLDREVKNGGFTQYFFNSSGDQWESALSGLMAINATETAAIFQETLNRFPNQAPSPDWDTRREQLSAVTKKDDPFHDQDRAYFKTPENLDRLLYRYNMSNIEDRLPQE